MGVAGEVVEGGLVGAGCGAQPGGGGWVWVGEFGQPGAQKVIVSVGEEGLPVASSEKPTIYIVCAGQDVCSTSSERSA